MCGNQVIILFDKAQVSPYASAYFKNRPLIYILLDLEYLFVKKLLLVTLLSLMTISWSHNFVGLTNLKKCKAKDKHLSVGRGKSGGLSIFTML